MINEKAPKTFPTKSGISPVFLPVPPENSIRLDITGLRRILIGHDPRVKIVVVVPFEEMP